jgi:hypothetical protein
MDIKRIILNELLIESKIAQIVADIKISFDVRSTKHSNTQRFRHKDSNNVIITNSDIRNVIEKAKSDIAFYIVQNKITNNSIFIVSDSTGDKLISLSIVAEELTPYQWNLIITTVWSEKASGKSFMVGRNQFHIVV